MSWLLIIMFFPVVQLRLKMKLPENSSKWAVINSSFFMRAPKWRSNLWWTSLWSCQFYVMMCLELHLRSFFSFSFICCLFVCISLHAHIEDNEHFKCRGGFRKNLSVFCFSILCFLFSVFIVSVSVFCFNFCVCIYFMFLFSYILFCLFFYICMLFCFFVVVFYFRFYVLLYVLCFVVLLFLHIEKNKDFVVVFC